MLALYPSNINRQAQYEQAVKILHQTTLVVDIACLDDGMLAVGDLLHLPREPIQTKIPRNKITMKENKITLIHSISYPTRTFTLFTV